MTHLFLGFHSQNRNEVPAWSHIADDFEKGMGEVAKVHAAGKIVRFVRVPNPQLHGIPVFPQQQPSAPAAEVIEAPKAHKTKK